MCEEIDQLENDLKGYLNNFSELVDAVMHDNTGMDESIDKANK